ncbi:MAG: SusC/RagA family TonB-linked outer membrane protein, partial [Bacteroidota bacterium]|nr:SusC/RagA family TonB-linked outer membrane protein [Bacteroidota bacterium]
DIESIQILKDAASASIYGSRAANGVILVTTKRGKDGKANFSVNYTSTYTFNPAMPKITGGAAERRYRLQQLKGVRTAYRTSTPNGYSVYTNPTSFEESAKNQAQYDFLWYMGKGADAPTVQDSLNTFYNNSTNWFDQILRVGKVNSVNIQTSGGSKTFNYHVGAGYYNEKGVIIGSDFTRINMLGNFTLRPVNNMLLDFRVFLARTDRGGEQSSANADMALIPLEPFNLSSLLPGKGTAVYDQAFNLAKGIMNKNIDYRVRTNNTISYSFLPNLKLSSSVAIDFWQNMMDYFSPSYMRTLNESYVSGRVKRTAMILNENLLSYNFKIAEKNAFDFLLGQSVQIDEVDDILGAALGGPSDYIHYASSGFPSLSTDANGVPRAMQMYSSDMNRKALLSYFGRFNYSYDGKYLASFSLRRDGSSTFGENRRWGTFPSGSLGWIFSEEPFLKDVSWLDMAKIRASVGKSGNQFSSPYLALGVYTPSANTFMGSSIMEPYWDEGLYNPYLSWENTTQSDLGLDLNTLNNRLKFVVDYYDRRTNNLLAKVVLPSAGSNNPYKQQWQNAYSISNKGLEFEVIADLINKKDFSWELTFNIARNWNKFEGSSDRRDFYNGSTNMNVVGQPLNAIMVYKQIGIYQTDSQVPTYDYIKPKYVYSLYAGSAYWRYGAGDPIYLDVNQDGQITTDDKVNMGSPLPEFTGGFTNLIKWKNFDLNCLCSYVLGRTVLDASMGKSLNIDIDPTTPMVHTLHPILTDLSQYKFWESANDGSDLPMIQGDPGKKIFSNRTSAFVKKISFMRLKTMILGYNIPKPFKNSNVSMRFYVSGENLFTVTNYKGRDPETIDVVTGIDDAQTYPLSTRVTLGATINF